MPVGSLIAGRQYGVGTWDGGQELRASSTQLYYPIAQETMADVSELTTSPQVQLYAFARAGRLDAIQELFAANSALNVNAPDQTGKTVRALGAKRKKEWRDEGVGLTCRAMCGREEQPLHYAAQFGWPAVVGFLLEQGAEQSVCETTGDTPLHFAAFKGHTQVVRVLMEAGADPTVSNEDGKFPHQLCDEGGATHQVLFDAYSEAYAVDPADLEGSSEYSDDDDDEDDEDEE